MRQVVSALGACLSLPLSPPGPRKRACRAVSLGDGRLFGWMVFEKLSLCGFA